MERSGVTSHPAALALGAAALTALAACTVWLLKGNASLSTAVGAGAFTAGGVFWLAFLGLPEHGRRFHSVVVLAVLPGATALVELLRAPSGFGLGFGGAAIVWSLGLLVIIVAHPLPPLSGRCVRCGYCLVGNRSGVCPECGQAVGDRAAGRFRGRTDWGRLVMLVLALPVAGPVLAIASGVASEPPHVGGGSSSSVHSMLQTVRSQIELYNVQNPAAPFDPTLGWRQLIDGDYLQAGPRNPFASNQTTLSLGRAPDRGTDWAWCTDESGDPASLTVRPRDEDGRVLDADPAGNPY